MSINSKPSISLEILKKRAWLNQAIRTFMSERGVLEVETPIIDTAANTDPNIDSLETQVNRPDLNNIEKSFLHTSPEFHMKRLIAEGSGSIYQICKVFRNNESGTLHRTEFSMLEYYRTGLDYHELMDEINMLLRLLGLSIAAKQPYGELFFSHTGLDPHTASLEDLHHCAEMLGCSSILMDRAQLLDLIFSHTITTKIAMDTPLFIYDYPQCQAALAKIIATEIPVAQRFELFLAGMEIANGYNEIEDKVEYFSRFEQENEKRVTLGKPVMPVDEKLLNALTPGLPACAGVAIGLDRLLMVITGSNHIEDVLAFS